MHGRITLKLEEIEGRKYVTVWYKGKNLRRGNRVRVELRSDLTVSRGTLRALRNLLEREPVSYVPKHLSDGYAVYLVAESDEEVEKAVVEALANGSSTLGVRFKLLKVSWEERKLSVELRKRGVYHVTNVYFQDYNIDLLIPESRIVVEVDGLYHYQDRIREKDASKLKLLREKGYDVFRIDASEIRKDAGSVAEMLRTAHLRRLEKRSRKVSG